MIRTPPEKKSPMLLGRRKAPGGRAVTVACEAGERALAAAAAYFKCRSIQASIRCHMSGVYSWPTPGYTTLSKWSALL